MQIVREQYEQTDPQAINMLVDDIVARNQLPNRNDIKIG